MIPLMIRCCSASLLGLPLAYLAADSVQAQDRKIEASIKHRRTAFTLMGTYTNRLVQTIDGRRRYDPARSLCRVLVGPRCRESMCESRPLLSQRLRSNTNAQTREPRAMVSGW